MSFDLLADSWIPLAGPDGSVVWATPVQVALAPPGSRIAWPRADFTGATHEFLIGLLTLALLPEDAGEWRDLWEAPPSAEALREALASHAAAFVLDGDGPRFLQDAGAVRDGRESGVAALLIDAPGENALGRNMDVFVKRGAVEVACARCAAAALYTLQTWAPSGGKGHRTGLRGGGPLTTLIVDVRSLWRTLWANVLDRTFIEKAPIRSDDPFAPGPVFPWMGDLRLSEAKGSETRPHHAPWMQVFFGQPRRIWLDVQEGRGETCDLCGEAHPRMVRRWWTRSYGVNYEGGWVHPLSPWSMEPDKPETRSARKGSPDGPDWRDWLGLVATPPEGKRDRARGPAPAVEHFRKAAPDAVARLWAFGYDTDNMKARGWNDATMPVLALPPQDGEQYTELMKQVAALVDAANEARGALFYALKRAISHRPADVKSEFSPQRARFLDLLRADFEALLNDLCEQARAGDLSWNRSAAKRLHWHRRLAAAAVTVFDEATAILPLDDDDPEKPLKERVGPVAARVELRNGLYGKKLAEALNLTRETLLQKEIA